MKLHTQYLWVVLLAVLVAGSSLAADTLKQYGDIMGRTYHEELYTENMCDACHTTNDPKGYPPDDCCAECHELEELVAATAREGEDLWQNPHNNLHYGKDVPCMECHGEHSRRAPMCAECHNFNYTKHTP